MIAVPKSLGLIEAGQELDELICSLAGWQVIVNQSEQCATLVNPEGKAVNTWIGRTLDHAILIAWNNAPHPSRNADDALELLKDKWPTVALIYLDDEWSCQFGTISSRLRDHGDGRGATLPLAICRAWLDWRGRQ